MEALRRKLAGEPELYPELARRKDRLPSGPQGVISIASSESSNLSSSPPPRRPKTNINSRPKAHQVISISDSEDDDIQIITPPKANSTEPDVPKYGTLGERKTSDSFSHTKNNASIQPRNVSQTLDDFGDVDDDGPALNPEQAKKALHNLLDEDMNSETTAEYAEEDYVVPGFKDGLRLMPHQIEGRRFMANREDPENKRFGGILADDMGLGKTVQALTRIVEGKPKVADKEAGWAPTTLVVCPLALLAQWKDEIETKTKKVTVIEHHGPRRTGDPSELQKHRVVLTTYDVVRSEHDVHMKGGKSAEASKSKGPKDALFRVKWFRIFLDEAHTIKNQSSKGSVACRALRAKFRWCLTGTPMQNDVAELYPIFDFLHIKPLSDWPTFKVQIAQPIKNGKGATRAMKRLQVVLKTVMLRRKKTDTVNGKPLLHLPARTVQIVSCPFDVGERIFYENLEDKMSDALQKLLEAEGNKAYISALLLLLRLRQACNHPVLVSKDYKTDIQDLQTKTQDNEDVDDLADALAGLGVKPKCQLCQQELDSTNKSDDNERYCLECAPLASGAGEERNDSAKIRMVLKLLGDIETRADGEEKTIVFSQFTSMLDLIQPFLSEKGIRFVRYDGSMKKQEREDSLQQIKTNDSVKVILISFKAGSTGLNLTACNNVILVDLWWNPALEDQAFDRAHRMGQKRDVNIYKLKIDNTVEERILLLQEKKRLLAAAALSGDQVKGLNKLGMNELLDLFRPGGRDDDEEDFD